MRAEQLLLLLASLLWSLDWRWLWRGLGDGRDVEAGQGGEEVHCRARSSPKVEWIKKRRVRWAGEYMARGMGFGVAGGAVGALR